MIFWRLTGECTEEVCVCVCVSGFCSLFLRRIRERRSVLLKMVSIISLLLLLSMKPY